jgi:hypothetical protein
MIAALDQRFRLPRHVELQREITRSSVTRHVEDVAKPRVVIVPTSAPTRSIAMLVATVVPWNTASIAPGSMPASDVNTDHPRPPEWATNRRASRSAALGRRREAIECATRPATEDGRTLHSERAHKTQDHALSGHPHAILRRFFQLIQVLDSPPSDVKY